MLSVLSCKSLRLLPFIEVTPLVSALSLGKGIHRSPYDGGRLTVAGRK